ncbi:MAG: depupylase/deamidase Dop [Bifidobacterium aquikefiri]|uniref:Ligase n=1 Tax=Bifidobacterium aquikefiri TaxID=1653207 RepID=A0A261G219_9BIFI|nr:depupylase/deamidase Dop [Bifidobacterium aquikefiri]OZG65489.1 ligase [Bifidobacterium aquikefiri]
MSVLRLMGTETEYAVSDFEDSAVNPLQLPFDVVAGAADPQTQGIRWDYGEEDPTNDARGMRLSRASAPASMLTDAPQLHITNVIAPNGGRIYVDHAHPEYSAPETTDPFAALCYDHAGDMLMEQAVARACSQTGRRIELHRNNVDGKGASWGTHENYQMLRGVPFQNVQQLMTAHFVSRQIFAGSGRVGIGERSEIAGYQLSQRADYIHDRIGLQTTFDRPIINTRDESHSTADRRRLHVIVGDANRMDVPQVLKLGTTSMLLWMLETRYLRHTLETSDPEESIDFVNPVDTLHAISHDLSLARKFALDDGGAISAIDMQTRLYQAVERTGYDVYGCRAHKATRVNWPDNATEDIMALWHDTLADLERIRDADDNQRLNMRDESSRIEWFAKWQILELLRRRMNPSNEGKTDAATWADSRLRALDLSWSALDARHGLFSKLSSRCEHLIGSEELNKACTEPPETTRAWLRSQLIRRFPDQIIGVTWGRMTVADSRHAGNPRKLTLDMRDSENFDRSHCEATLLHAGSAAECVELLSAGGIRI